VSFIKMEDIGIQQLSHSRMKTHEQCPRKARYKFIDKLKEPSSEAMDRGSRVHKELEDWLAGELGTLRSEVQVPTTGVYAAIRSKVAELIADGYDVSPERQAAFTVDWEPCPWFGPQVFMRVVYDWEAVKDQHAVLCDYKTGKMYDDHEQQAKLYALGAFKEHKVNAVEVVFYYIDQCMMKVFKYTRDDEFGLQAGVMERANRVRMDRLFPTNPSWKCKYCHFRP
jgi:CRISPR/Cas system-associated exonuclease Cas4 (RecB family)